MRLLLMIMAASIASAAAAAATPVPAKMQGVWGKNGRCDRLKDRLTITAHRAGWGKGPFDPVDFDTVDPRHAIHWSDDRSVDNFTFGANQNFLIHHLEGFGSALPSDAYARCGRKMVRVAFPE